MTLLPIILPQDAVLKVSVGDKISAGDIVAQAQSNSNDEILHLSKDYKINPKKIKKYLLKNLGDKVEVGEAIAKINGVLGITSQNIISNFSGIIAKIDESIGEVHVKKLDVPDAKNIFSPVDGTIDFCNNEKIVIKTAQEAFVAADAVGNEGSGKLKVIEEYDPEKLTAGVLEKIPVVKKIDNVSLFKIIGLGGEGIIIQELEDMDFVDLSEKKIEIPVMIVSADNFEKIAKKDGSKVYLNGESKSIVIL
jgi:hypothetical protein